MSTRAMAELFGISSTVNVCCSRRDTSIWKTMVMSNLFWPYIFPSQFWWQKLMNGFDSSCGNHNMRCLYLIILFDELQLRWNADLRVDRIRTMAAHFLIKNVYENPTKLTYTCGIMFKDWATKQQSYSQEEENRTAWKIFYQQPLPLSSKPNWSNRD